MDKRTFLIVDEAYLNSIANSLNCRFDVLKLRRLLEERFGKITRFYYVSTMDGAGQVAFHHWLKTSARAEVIVRGRKGKTCRSCGAEYAVEKGVDVFMATTAIKFAHQGAYDRLILANGDGDLLDALLYLRDDLCKEIVLVGTVSTASADTRLVAESFVDLTCETVFPSIVREVF